MKRKELLAEKKKIENRMSSHIPKRPYESNSRWRQVKSELDDKDNIKDWWIKYLNFTIAIAALIISIIAIFN